MIGGPGSAHWDPPQQRAVILYLVEAGADPNATAAGGVTPLHRAVRNRCSAAVEALLSAGCRPSPRERPRVDRVGPCPLDDRSGWHRLCRGQGRTGHHHRAARQRYVVVAARGARDVRWERDRANMHRVRAPMASLAIVALLVAGCGHPESRGRGRRELPSAWKARGRSAARRAELLDWRPRTGARAHDEGQRGRYVHDHAVAGFVLGDRCALRARWRTRTRVVRRDHEGGRQGEQHDPRRLRVSRHARDQAGAIGAVRLGPARTATAAGRSVRGSTGSRTGYMLTCRSTERTKERVVTTNVPSVTLNNAVEMPILGFGVDQIPRRPVLPAPRRDGPHHHHGHGSLAVLRPPRPGDRQPAQQSTRPVTGLGTHR